MDQYYLEKPDLKNVDKEKTLQKFIANERKYRPFVFNVSEPEYLYWDKVKYKSIPDGLSKEEFWFLVAQIRKLSSQVTPIKAESGEFFTWIRLTYTDEYLHKIDTQTGGQIFTSLDLLKNENKQKFIARGILEEAIASSQLEGANTTRKAAKMMILEKRAPRNTSERMIINNYNTMKMLEQEYKNKELSRELLFEMHSMLTKDTVSIHDQNRFRKNTDEIVVRNDKVIAFIPPNEKFLYEEIDRLISFANETEKKVFIHPVIHAIFIHFWIGYLHPFTDGNGRLARALFYWYLLRKGYWTFMYLPISTIIKNSPAQYSNAYIYTEQDGLDLTYFYDYNMRKIMLSFEEFNTYVEKVSMENKSIDSLLGKTVVLNYRQKQLVHYLLSETEEGYVTISSHTILNNIGRRTSSTDLKYLEQKGLLTSKKEGKYTKYYLSSKVKDIILKKSTLPTS